MRKFLKRPSVWIMLVGLAALAAMTIPSILANTTPHAGPPAPIPAPVASDSPSAMPTKPLPSTAAGGQAAGEVIAPAPSEEGKLALSSLKFHWEVFVKALREIRNNAGLTDDQLIMPPIVLATDLSGCPPGAGNQLDSSIVEAAGFCDGQIKLVSSAFNDLNDNEQRKAAASTFIYHALATTNAEQRSRNYRPDRTRSDLEMLGCLQWSLSRAFDRYGATEDVWVVMSKRPNDAVYSAYYAADEWGKWS